MYKLSRAVGGPISRALKLWAGYRIAVRPYRRDGSGFHSDLKSCMIPWSPAISSARLRLLLAGIEQLEGQISHCTMSFEAVPRMLVRVPLPWPYLAMSRVTLEASSRIIYLTDPKIDVEQRLMRFAALSLWSFNEGLRATRASAGRLSSEMMNDITVSIQRDLMAFEKTIHDAGFEVFKGKDGTRASVVRDPLGNRRAEVSSLNISEVLETQFPGVGGEIYRRYSGFIHGTPSAHYAAMQPYSEELFVPALSDQTVAETYMIVIQAVRRAMGHASNYGGFPFHRSDNNMEKALKAVRKELTHLYERETGHVVGHKPRPWHVLVQRLPKHASSED